MAVQNLTTDYTGRTRDICIVQGISLSGQKTDVTLAFGSVSTFCAGVQKLIQRYMIAFLTAAGSQIDFPDFGTSFFVSIMGANNNPGAIQAQHVFNFANAKVIDAFRQYQASNPGLPDDEQIDTAVLAGLVSSGDAISFTVNLVTKAGTTIDFVVPLPIQS